MNKETKTKRFTQDTNHQTFPLQLVFFGKEMSKDKQDALALQE